jgi:ribosomal protein S10
MSEMYDVHGHYIPKSKRVRGRFKEFEPAAARPGERFKPVGKYKPLKGRRAGGKTPIHPVYTLPKLRVLVKSHKTKDLDGAVQAVKKLAVKQGLKYSGPKTLPSERKGKIRVHRVEFDFDGTPEFSKHLIKLPISKDVQVEAKVY